MAVAPTRRAARTGWRQALARILLSNATTLLLAAAALALGSSAFAIFNGEVPSPTVVFGLVLATVVVLLPLLALMAARVTGVWFERRRGVAGARLHVRLVLLFGGVAVVPTIVMAIFASVFFNMVVQNWFNDNVRTALSESLQVARGYADEHRNKIRADAIEMGIPRPCPGAVCQRSRPVCRRAGRTDRIARADRGDDF